MTTRLFRIPVAAIVATSLALSSLPAATAATKDPAPTAAEKSPTAKKSGDSPDTGTGDNDSNERDEIPPLPRNNPPYKEPGLSSSPSSNEPGLSYQLRGLSSQIADPLGGITTFLGLIAAWVFLDNIYTSMELSRVRALREQGVNEPVITLNQRLSQAIFPPHINEQLNPLSSRIPGSSYPE